MHQIRVHLDAIGHPILGDSIYHPTSTTPRLCLHAWMVSLIKPFLNKEVVCEASLDEVMKDQQESYLK